MKATHVYIAWLVLMAILSPQVLPAAVILTGGGWLLLEALQTLTNKNRSANNAR